MRTNIDIDDELMARAMQAGPFKTKREAVEAGLKLLTRQAAYKEILKWRGKLKWEGDEGIDWSKAPAEPATAAALSAEEPTPARYKSPTADAGRPAKGRQRRARR